MKKDDNLLVCLLSTEMIHMEAETIEKMEASSYVLLELSRT